MATKKVERYINMGAGSAMKLQLDPEYYNATLGTILGVAATTAATNIVPVTIRQAARSTNAVLLRCRIEKGTGDLLETRTIRLLCDKDQVDTAKAQNTGLVGKTIQIGGTTQSSWEIKSVA